MRISLSTVALAIAIASSLPAQSYCARLKAGTTGLVFGDHHAFIVQAPKGWVPELVRGFPVAFHRIGETWADGTAVMYVNTATVESGDAKPPERVIAEDSVRFREHFAGIHVAPLDPLRTSDGREVLLRRFSGDASGNVEAVAYVRERTVTPIITLTARTQAAYTSSLDSFHDLVRSYEFLTSEIREIDGPPCRMRYKY